MRRSRLFRSLIGLWGAWLTVAISEPAAIHNCPVHGDHAAHAGMDAHAMPMEHAGHRMDAGTDSHGSHKTPACSCVGACCSVAPSALPTPLVVFAPLAALHAVPVEPQQAVPHRARPHALPFANGPPTLS